MNSAVSALVSSAALIAIASLSARAALAAETPEPVAKLDPAATVHIDTETLTDYDGYPLHLSWQHGFLVAGSRADFPTRHDQVTLFDTNGKLVRKLNVLLPESKWANLVSAAVLDNKGTIAVAVNAHTADFPEPAAVVGIFDSKGKLVRTFRTEPFHAQSICADADGDLWAFNVNRLGQPTEPQWLMLRRFAQDGQQLSAVMPRGEYLDRKVGTRSNDQLFCGKDRLSIFLQKEETYLEVGYDGKLLDKFLVPSILSHGLKDPHNPPHFQLTEGGMIVAVWSNSTYYLDRVSKVWKRIAWENEQQYSGFAGKQADGSMIIIAGGTHDTQFDWLKIPLDLPDAYPDSNVPAPALVLQR